MGQKITKAISGGIRVPKSLGRAIDSHEKNLKEYSLRDIARKRSEAKGSFIDPSAATAGFTRGTSSEQTSRSRQDEEQEKFLKQKNSKLPSRNARGFDQFSEQCRSFGTAT